MSAVCVVAAHRGRSPAALQPSAGDGGDPEIPRRHSHLQLHPGSDVCTHTHTQPHIHTVDYSKGTVQHLL